MLLVLVTPSLVVVVQPCMEWIPVKTRIHWLNRRIVRKELDIMPIYHYVQNQGKLMIQKTSTWAIFWRFQSQKSLNCKFFWKIRFIQKNHYSRFREKYQSVWFWANFANISKLRILFKNPVLTLLYLHSPLTSCKISEKSLEPFLRKQRYQPTNQPIIINNTDPTGPRWHRSKK